MLSVISGHTLVVLDPHCCHLGGGCMDIPHGEPGIRVDLRRLKDAELDGILGQLVPLEILGTLKVSAQHSVSKMNRISTPETCVLYSHFAYRLLCRDSGTVLLCVKKEKENRLHGLSRAIFCWNVSDCF